MKRNQLDFEWYMELTCDERMKNLDIFTELYSLNHDDYLFDLDECLEELFSDSDVEFTDIQDRDKNIQYDDCGIIQQDDKHYKVIGYDVVVQNNVKFKIPVVCMFNGCVYCDGYDLLRIKQITE